MSIPAALADAVISFSQDDNDAATEALFSANPLSKVSKIAQGVRKGVSNGTKNAGTLKAGSFAKKSIPARGPNRNFNKAERDKINNAGRIDGCHTCGAPAPGTKSGNFIPDHQPPSSLNINGGSQQLFPHCKGCSQRQGGQVTQEKRRLNGQ